MRREKPGGKYDRLEGGTEGIKNKRKWQLSRGEGGGEELCMKHSQLPSISNGSTTS